MSTDEKIEVRDLKDGDWYWIDKAFLLTYGRRLKASGIAVYNALAWFADFKTQTCFPTQEAIAKLVGLSRRTVSRKIRLLGQLNLIKVEMKKGSCLYYLLEPEDAPNKTQVCDRKGISDGTGGNTNNNKLTINNNNIEDRNFLDFRASKSFKPKTREELLALDLAEGLNDRKNLPLYLSYAKRFPESLLRSFLGRVKEIPLPKIKKGRAALFHYLIRKHARETTQNLGD